MRTLKITVFQTTNRNIELIALINGTYVMITPKQNLVKGVVLPNDTVKGFYKYYKNPNFKYLVGTSANFCIKVDNQDFYGKIGLIDHFLILRKSKGLWVQNFENIKWLLTFLISVMAIIVSFLIFFCECIK